MAEYVANADGGVVSADGGVVGNASGDMTTASGGVVGNFAIGEDVHLVEWGQTTVLDGGGGEQVRGIPRLVRG